MIKLMKRTYGFTIVELLVVIVVIGVLAAITVVSYTGISNRAIVASLQSDLSNASKQFKLYTVDFGSYPTGSGSGGLTQTSTGSGVWCPNVPPNVDSKYCLRLSGGNQFVSYDGTATGYKLVIKNGNNFYVINDGSNAVAMTSPILINPTSASITSSGASIGATISSDGNAPPITEFGTCWGTNINPTTNCSPINPGVPGVLTSNGTVASGSYPTGVSISADGTSVYVANMISSNLSMYTRNTSTGVLTANGTISGSGMNLPTDVGVSADGKSVYVANDGGNTISMLSRDTGTGLLTSNGTIATGSQPWSIVISADGKSVYTNNSAGGSISMFNRDTGTGVLSANGSISTATFQCGIAISADGKSFYNVSGSSISMFNRDTGTGTLTANGSISTGTNSKGITVSPNGSSVYVANGGTNTVSIYNRDTGTGVLTAIGTIPTGTYPYGIAISADGTSVYTANYSSTNISIFNRDTGTGALTANGTIATSNYPEGIAVSSDGTSAYATNYFGGTTVSMYSRGTGIRVGVPFTQSRTGMPSNALIHYRGYAINSVGTGYAPDATFTTLP